MAFYSGFGGLCGFVGCGLCGIACVLVIVLLPCVGYCIVAGLVWCGLLICALGWVDVVSKVWILICATLLLVFVLCCLV